MPELPLDLGSVLSTPRTTSFRLMESIRSASIRSSPSQVAPKPAYTAISIPRLNLAIAFLDRREVLWTRGWLESEIKRRATNPKERLLAIFDVFDDWFRKKSFEGCSFINVLLESNAKSPLHRTAAIHLAKIRAIIRDLAEEAKLREPEKFAQAWHMLMKGSIVSACEGNKNAAREAKRAAQLVLEGWGRAGKLRLRRQPLNLR